MKFGVILADPPWLYANNRDNDPKQGGAQYNQEQLEYIASIPMHSIAKPDCAVFMWATMPLLSQAFYVLGCWGFRYITCAFVWVKLNPTGRHERVSVDMNDNGDARMSDILYGGTYSGLGHWVNGNAELCLMAKQGRPQRKDKNVKQIIYQSTLPEEEQVEFSTEVIFVPRGIHSAKPKEIHTRIENLIVDEDRVEFFARESHDGWTTAGYDINREDIYTSIRRLESE